MTFDKLDDRFRRVTTSRNFLPEIDGLRFLAILPIVWLHLGTHYLRHAAGTFSPPLEQDWMYRVRSVLPFGVPLFFAVSGFILSLPFLREATGNGRVTVSAYFLRRITRLEPPYVVSLTGFLLVHLFLIGTTVREALPHYFASLFYMHNLAYGRWSTINPVAWSLEIEVQFYVLAPILCRTLFRRPAAIRIVAAVGLLFVFAGCMAKAGSLSRWHLTFSLLTHGHFFITGVLMADWFVHKEAFFRRRGLIWDMIGLLSLCGWAGWFVPRELRFLREIAGTMILPGLFLGAFKGLLLNRIFTWAPLWIVGGMCYSIYLLHYPLIHLTVSFTSGLRPSDAYWLNQLVQVAVHFPIILLVCGVFYLFVEKPCMDREWPQRLWRSLRGRAQGADDQTVKVGREPEA